MTKNILIALTVILPMFASAQTYTTNAQTKIVTVTQTFRLTTTLPVYEGLKAIWTTENVVSTNATAGKAGVAFTDWIETSLEQALTTMQQQRSQELNEWMKSAIVNASATKQAAALKVLLAK
jgi:hypothetical protein